MDFFKDKKILISGGTGSFGKEMTRYLLTTKAKKIYIFSRDELKQYEMKQEFDSNRLQFFIGDIRDENRLNRAFNNIDIIIHAAAQKHVPSCEYNPYEAVKTNIIGAQNIVNAAINNNVKKVIALSTDKAVEPLNLYGTTKACMEKLFICGNAYSGGKTEFACVRYGNVMNSRGSVIPYWMSLSKQNKKLPLTDINMTRFWLSIKDAVKTVIIALKNMTSGEIYVPKLPSMKLIDLAEAINENMEIDIIGIRQGEKIHETLINFDESRNVLESNYFYTILPDFHWLRIEEKTGPRHLKPFEYSSNNNSNWISIDEMRKLLCQIEK